MPVAGAYFDGTTARRHAVTLDIADGRVSVHGDGVDGDFYRSEPLGAMQFSQALGATARIVRFPGGAICEVTDVAELGRMLVAAGIGHSRVSIVTDAKRLVAAAVVLIAVIMVVGYRYGVPVAAGVVAHRLPAPMLGTLGRQTLSTLDRIAFTPSEVPLTRQQQIASEFAALRQVHNARVNMHILFRKSDLIGANALALPSGDIVVTDALLPLIHDDRELMGVLLHESGHVSRRHSVQLLLENSVVSLFLAWYVGDVNTLVVTAPTALMQAKYTRDFEREADADALAGMALNGIPSSLLADALERMDAERSAKRGEPAGGERGKSAEGLAAKYLSSHPATSERLQMLRR